ncbi:MAG: hypothetical protein J0I42_18025 [Bosea sp.]|uniref:hypothetical protein n=1 Tax=Bosea sp. (in: a-proteobacteria) TaxID=1871050 RepID=UPI001ACEE56B|nr:hypothetical protein [Bosea sp. (in: a-proteobacteria)]MBN9453840.1 hypothetical protein [Bosea sp. (in: a-proteobacteria)]
MTDEIVAQVDPLIPLMTAFNMAGLKCTKGYEELKAKRLTAVRNGTRRFIRASEVRRYIDAVEAASRLEAA